MFDIFLKVIFYVLIVKFNFLDSVHNFSSSGSYIQNFYQLSCLLLLLFLLIHHIKSFSTNIFFISSSENMVYLYFLIINIFFSLFIFYEFFLIFWKDTSTVLFFVKYRHLYVIMFTMFAFYFSTYYHYLFLNGLFFLPY